MTEPTGETVTLTLASEVASIDVMEKAAEDLAVRGGFDDDAVYAITLACREAAANAILHGNSGDARVMVSAVLTLNPDELTMVFADQGSGFEVADVPDPLAAENMMRGSGRGVFLMRSLMDSVEFRHLNPGTEVTLVKRRPSAQ